MSARAKRARVLYSSDEEEMAANDKEEAMQNDSVEKGVGCDNERNDDGDGSDFVADDEEDEASVRVRAPSERRAAPPELLVVTGPREPRDHEAGNARAQQLREEQAVENQQFLSQFFEPPIDLRTLGASAIDDAPIEVFVKQELPEFDFPNLMSLAADLMPGPREGRQHDMWDICQVEKFEMGAKLLMAMRMMLQWLITGGYRILDAFIKIQRDNDDPWHMDAVTGVGMFSRAAHVGFAAGTRPGLRLLINLGAYDARNGRRTMKFGVRQPDNSIKVLYETDARVVAMIGTTAGSAGTSDVLHARFGNGITLCADGVLPIVGGRNPGGRDEGSGLRKTLTVRSQMSVRELAIDGWFRKPLDEVRKPFNALGRLNPTLTDETAVDAAARTRAQVFPLPHVADAVRHCHRCGVRGDERYDSVTLAGVKVMCCYECTRAESRRRERNFSVPFLRFYTCPDECTGCKFHNKPRAEFTLGTRPTALQSKQARATAHAKEAANATPHCSLCQVPIEALQRFHFRSDLTDDEGVQLVGCVPCLELVKKKGNRERLALCPANCTGCRRSS